MKQYATIVADPPWKTSAGPPSGEYKVVDGKQVWNLSSKKSRPLAYQAMSVDEIKALQIPAADDAHLYLWTTNGYLPDAFEVIKAWGFTYSTTLVWAKNPFGGGGLGGAYRITTEFLLFARKGSLPAISHHIGTWFNVKREYDERGKPQHSRKPSSFYELIASISPGPYLEMFARRPRDGWHVWGNEVESDVEIAA